MRRVLPFAFSALVCQLQAQDQPFAVGAPQVQEPAAATLGLAEHIPWRSDGQEYYELDRAPKKVKVDRMALIDAACADAKQQGKLVLWYVHRIQEKTLQGPRCIARPCSTSMRGRCCSPIRTSASSRRLRSSRCAA
jgi:hypothetical protein